MSGMARVMFVLGGPACGKGTACQAAELTGNFWHISAGELLRQNVPSEHKDLVEKCFTEGKIVPAHITVDLLHQRMKKLGWSSKPFLIDGFPRNMLNYNTWFSQMPLASVEKAVYFWCPEHLFFGKTQKETRQTLRRQRNNDWQKNAKLQNRHHSCNSKVQVSRNSQHHRRFWLCRRHEQRVLQSSQPKNFRKLFK
mmetsp:Transcript_7632/g.11236  ORF Transcript_7632/g.11236 Transcript_7632/m.11236 type:complete len:196 (-) Transcript_7632:22-609(-)